MKHGGCVYILTNKHHTVLYTGVTSDLKKRLWQHQNREFAESFTARYNCNQLVYYENFSRIEEAITREKQIKGESRNAKETLINKFNPNGMICRKRWKTGDKTIFAYCILDCFVPRMTGAKT